MVYRERPLIFHQKIYPEVKLFNKKHFKSMRAFYKKLQWNAFLITLFYKKHTQTEYTFYWGACQVVFFYKRLIFETWSTEKDRRFSIKKFTQTNFSIRNILSQYALFSKKP